VRCKRRGAEPIEGMRSCSCGGTVVSESGISRSRSNLSKTAWAIGSIFCLVGLIFFLGCESKEKQDSGSRSATASVTATAAPNPVALPGRHLPEQTRVQSATEIRQRFLDRSRQATQEEVAALERSNENYSRATEQYERETSESLDQYRSMTAAERAQIHPKSLKQIGLEHDAEIRQAQQTYAEAMESVKREYGEEMASLPLAETDPEPTSGVDAQTAKFIGYEGITLSTLRLFGLLGGMPGASAELQASQLGFRLIGREDKGNGFEYSTFARASDEQLRLIIWDGELETVDYNFGAGRYDSLLKYITTKFGNPTQHNAVQCISSDSWGGLPKERGLQLIERMDRSGAATLSFWGGRFKKHMSELGDAAAASIPDRGEAELIPGRHFSYERYPQGYLADQLCSEIVANQCFPRGWRPWLKDLEQRTVGDQMDALRADTGGQGPGNRVIAWDTQKRALFYGDRPHSGDDALVFFIVAPETRELDIVWKNEQGVKYLGPNASLLKAAHAYEWLKKLPW